MTPFRSQIFQFCHVRKIILSNHKMLIILLSILHFVISQTQNSITSPEIHAENHTGNSNQQDHKPRSNLTSVNLSMCNSNASETYCKCSEKVISCDFANAPTNQTFVIHLSARNIQISTQRICVCNTKRNVYIALKSKFLPAESQVHRIDFYNLNAEIDFAAASYLNFGGDLYMSKVKYLKRIEKLQFGRRDFEVQDVQDLDCCSTIRVAPLERPTLYIENTTIGKIEPYGIYPDHLWKTVILKFVRIQKGMERNAIVLHDKVNTSISHSFFNNLTDRAIVASGITNLVMIKSTFNHSCHPLAFGAMSNEPNSTIILIGNRFLNVPQLQLEAKWIVNWFNFYEKWDNDTFVIPDQNSTVHKDRGFSVEFNTVDTFQIEEHDFPEMTTDSNVVFSDNILSLCNCSLWRKSPFPTLLKIHHQRCDAHLSSENSKCTLKLKAFTDKCHSKSEPDLNKLCQDSAISLPATLSHKLVNLTFKALNLSLDSPFVLRMIREHEADCLYRMQKVVQYSKLFTYTEEEFERDDNIEYFEECTNITDNKHDPSDMHTDTSKSKSSSTTKTAIIIVFSIILIVAGGVCIIFLLRKKFVLGSPNRYMSLNTY